MDKQKLTQPTQLPSVQNPSAPESPSPSSHIPPSSQPKVLFRKKTLFLIVVILVLGVSFFLIHWYSTTRETLTNSSYSRQAKTSPVDNRILNTKSDTDIKTLTGKGYPVLYISKGEKTLQSATMGLAIYSFTKGGLNKIDSAVRYTGGGVEYGDEHPLVSPDFRYTVYIDDNTNNLWLVSNGNLQTSQITNIANKNVNILISGWSPDSHSLVYLLYTGSFLDGITTEGPGLGFFMYNLETKKITALPLNTFVSFLNSHQIVSTSWIGNDKEQLSIFDTNLLATVSGSIKMTLDPSDDQFSFTNDGTHWTFSHESGTGDSRTTQLIYTQFSKETGTVIDEGRYADIQWPTISPLGTKIAYIKKNSIWIYDTKTGERKSLTITGSLRKWITGTLREWIDEDTLIIDQTQQIPGNEQLSLLHVSTGKLEKME